jgi:hypothetical protein
VHDITHVVNWNVIQVEPEGYFQVEPLHIPNKMETLLWNKDITQVKVQWRHFSPEEATWEMEEVMRRNYPFLFQS